MMQKMLCVVPCKRRIKIRLVLVTLTIVSLVIGWHLSYRCSSALLPPEPNLALDHFRTDRSLKSYLEKINILIEPSKVVCPTTTQLLVLVTSAPDRFEHRDAVRNTWASHFPTYFIMGLHGNTVEDLMVENYVEAKMYSDVIIYKFKDHYQNLTLKTALMLEWTATRCPTDLVLFKTDDDVLVNPWVMKQLVKEHAGRDLVGYKLLNKKFHRDVYNKWFVPRWMLNEDHIEEYLSGTGYLINGYHLRDILATAYRTPMINLEDVYFTYLVSKRKLGLNLTHDRRLSPFKPWLPGACMYFKLASSHSLSPAEMTQHWRGVQRLGRESDMGNDVCGDDDVTWSEMFLY
ncbi:beta-1,3-galactosyltransferase 1-like isoform X2 [Danaus plexippus]|uniref:beta-1,3-galactosyltransferase 1-like isoform X2 n=1 Tax=Danaus plexippus TaxID=13037 RepID=UPI002AB2E82C|nr:beta-1,3-galactosyltransferase 1-like isoform X2 [Danaus plexippus]XP_032524078.2 beta-1,3-galactosyltransferase 1-like isoform X2 [Danaus plexippus]